MHRKIHPTPASPPTTACSAPPASQHSSPPARPVPAPSAEDAWIRRNAALEAEVYAARERRAAARRRNAEERQRAFADLCEASEGLAVVWRRESTPLADILAFADGDIWLLQTLVHWLRREATRRVARLKTAAKRPFYYAREKARRQLLAAERRRIARRTTENPCPTREQILDAWLKVGESNENLVRFGSLLEDLACYVDSSLLRDEDGAIVGRRGGIKAWLQTNIPALYLKYTTVMRYKAAAKKLRQLTGLVDPVPAARLVDTSPAPSEAATDSEPLGTDPRAATGTDPAAATGTDPRTQDERGCAQGAAVRDCGAEKSLALLRARAVYLEIAGDKPLSRTAFLARIDSFTDPERVEEATTLSAWREQYACEITVRRIDLWWRRLWTRQTG